MARQDESEYPLKGTLANNMSGSLFSYIALHDSGFAPNPFYGYCTLANCKPVIRRVANVGDWVIGTGSADKRVLRGGYLVYAMKITEVLKRAEYWEDARFKYKRPYMLHNWMRASGDNIYEPDSSSGWKQLDSYHSNENGELNKQHLIHDTKVDSVLGTEAAEEIS